jgi:prepilin-type N-terminal cleavage/methylation domain-containing protein
MRSVKGRLGFTLIELLIVVAIIAILAAIAVPNFLEAQTRAKVSRVLADQRTMATALESYAVDWNRAIVDIDESQNSSIIYPRGQPEWWWGIQVPGATDPNRTAMMTARFNRQWSQLTTPIAYITSIPKDPFCGGRTFTQAYVFWAAYETFDYKVFAYTHRQPNQDYLLDLIRNNGYQWSLTSRGPSMQSGFYRPKAMFGGPYENGDPKIWDPYEIGTDILVGGIYDATNGTVSYGQIIRTNKGVCKKGGGG